MGRLASEIADFAKSAPGRWQSLLDDPAVGGRLQGLIETVEARTGLGEQIRAVEARLDEQTAGDRVVERLRSIRGIGRPTNW